MRAPGPGLLRFIRGARARGFLAYVGDVWRAHGDVFQLKIGPRTLLFAIHPDAVEHVTVTNRQNYDKRRSYEDWAGDKIRNVVPLGRWQKPENVADMVVFLSSSRASEVTGQTINVDGGFVMHW